MHSLKSITASELSNIIKNRLSASVEIPASVTKFKQHIPGVDFTHPTEVPPSPTVLNAEGLAHAIIHGGGDLDGKYVRLVLFVYALGGKIVYTEVPTGDYEAAISWPAL